MQVLQSARRDQDQHEDQLLGRFLASRRRFRLQDSIRHCGPWEEHFASDGARYFYNNETQRTQWDVPDGWTLEDMGAAQAEQSRTCVEEAALKRALSFLP
eukprot:s1516_g8.t1